LRSSKRRLEARRTSDGAEGTNQEFCRWGRRRTGNRNAKFISEGPEKRQAPLRDWAAFV